MVQTVALPGGGFVIAWSAEAMGIEGTHYVQRYDANGQPLGEPMEVEGQGVVVASPTGTFVHIGEVQEGTSSRLVGQSFDANGAPVGDPVELGRFDAGTRSTYSVAPSERGTVLDAEGRLHLQIVETHLTGKPGVGPVEVNEFARAIFDAQGNPLKLATPIELPEDVHLLADGRLVAVRNTMATVDGVTTVESELEFRDAGGVTLGQPVVVSGLAMYDSIVLADGSIALLGNSYANGDLFSPARATLVRLDEHGTVLGKPAVLGFTAFGNGNRDSTFLPNQDGGFTHVWAEGEFRNWYYQVFDREGNAVTNAQVAASHPAGEWGNSPAMLADGRIVLGQPDGGDEDALPDVVLIDVPSTHDAQWGGTSTYIATWQDQERLTREDGIDFLRSDAGVQMKPWIANFEAASGADGINATGNALANHLLGGNGANVFIAGAGNDKLYGLGGNDWLLGEGGDDLIDGDEGHDVAIGGLGNDSIAAGAGADTVAGDQGDDAVSGGAGNDIVQGGIGDDFVNGDAGNDTLSGGSGDDWIHGGSGDDIVSGDRGADTLEGGAGADQFRFGPGSGHDVVLDFQYGVAADRIVIDLPADGTINGLTVDAAMALFDAAEDRGDGVLIGLGDGHSILLAGWQKSDLGADIFLLV